MRINMKNDRAYGHNFWQVVYLCFAFSMGMSHDDDHATCTGHSHIMSGEWVKGRNPSDLSWSSCSRDDLENFLRWSLCSFFRESDLEGHSETGFTRCFPPVCQLGRGKVCSGRSITKFLMLDTSKGAFSWNCTVLYLCIQLSLLAISTALDNNP